MDRSGLRMRITSATVRNDSLSLRVNVVGELIEFLRTEQNTYNKQRC